MSRRKQNTPSQNAAQHIQYFLSCYDDLHMSNYSNTSLEAFQLSEADFFWFDDCSSTNDVLLDHAKNKSELPPLICISDNQFDGRGQHGRKWLSGKGNLHFSMLMPTRNLFELDGKLALEVAMSLVDIPLLSSMKMNSQFRLGIKWPNDLCVLTTSKKSGKAELQKFGGILIEPVKDASGSLNAVIVGVGINVNNTIETVDGSPVANLSTLLDQSNIDTTMLAAQVCYACQHAVSRFSRGSSGIFARYYLHDLLYDQSIMVNKSDGSQLDGIASGVDIDGSLKLSLDVADTSADKTKMINLYDGQVFLK